MLCRKRCSLCTWKGITIVWFTLLDKPRHTMIFLLAQLSVIVKQRLAHCFLLGFILGLRYKAIFTDTVLTHTPHHGRRFRLMGKSGITTFVFDLSKQNYTKLIFPSHNIYNYNAVNFSPQIFLCNSFLSLAA